MKNSRTHWSQRKTNHWSQRKTNHWSSTPVNSYRSGLEERIAKELEAANIPVVFEQYKLGYVVPERAAKYTPDFILPNGIIIETKGLFTTEDRQKMRLIRRQHPTLDIRFVFQNANAKIAKQSPTSYAKWADTYGFKWAHKSIPVGWFSEPKRCCIDDVASPLVPVKRMLN